jgi:hypothetical protein
MKSIFVFLLLVIGALSVLQAQRDFKMTHKPSVDYMMPHPPNRLYHFVNEKPGLFSFRALMGEEVLDFFHFEIKVDSGLATIEKLPEGEGKYMVTPHLDASSSSIRIHIYVTTPGVRLLWPVPKAENLPLWDKHGEFQPQNVKKWEPDDQTKPLLIDDVRIRVIHETNQK